jgi:HEAT repeat protein
MLKILRTTRSIVFLAACLSVAVNSANAVTFPAVQEKEQELLDVLRSEAPAADKAITCKNLAIYGTDQAVPDLAALLADPHLSSWARIALEAIPGTEADAALRTAADTLKGRLLVGVINSIGVRQDATAVDLLTARLQDSDSHVASAAAVALGHIGNTAAADSLRAAFASAADDVRSAVAEGRVLCAERFIADGNATEAVKIYDDIREADVPMQRIIEATRGAILARNQDGIPLLFETFRSPNKKLFQLALGTVREFPGDKVDEVLATEMVRATPERAALMIQAMADRPETVVLAAVLKAAGQGDKQVRTSAIDALRRVGNESCLDALLNIAIETDADLAESAQNTLAGLPGDNVDEQIVALLPSAKGKTYPLLLKLIGQRRVDAVPDVLKALGHSDRTVRAAALIALGETITLDQLSVLISQVISPKHAEDSPSAQQALKAASIRMADREACAAELSAALKRSPSASKNVLLEILAEVGGSRALQTLATAAKSDDTQLQDTSSRLLGKWNNIDAAPVLLDLATTAPAEKFRVRALRGYIGIARKFTMSDAQRAEMCQNALGATRRPTEHKLVLDVLQIRPSTDALKLAVKAMRINGLKDDATKAALVIARKISGKGVDVSGILSAAGIEKIKLEITKAEYGAGATSRDVTAVVRKHASDSPLIILASASFNASFGGDPSPGVVKRLKIQYRINGKTGEASFAENALIILPMPK